MGCQSSSRIKGCKSLLTLFKFDTVLGTYMLSVCSAHGDKEGIEAVL
jgi:hypothetical protein